ncbi:hypothetical protein J2W32_005842 [Variovorax boronicumulans]|uniref:Uncharacterized protein n=1 Tax=Variovorax boronicumulans TaxID=436515 RepID=A0AAW8D6R3_9BURK|nr:hypothetical protein [Variovorax boronicumulans]MDP9896732.1 hypothetical protein [Variovorax boronicumulans]MDP9994083.1 hypothetical protein [Variovorax boronicumulans]MDQ0007315.1 hypothetical protein [Variovorax boronicumulans]MDQ0056773.1 hypothetical protein [Variovorax boronicumulans]
MIGFELKARGSYGFKQSRSAWTEGSLIALKAVALADNFANKTQQTARNGALTQIEEQFKKIADARFGAICSFGLDFTLFLEGDIKLKYFFDSRKNSSQIQSEFLNALRGQTAKLGDQVVIYMAQTIEDFVTTVFDKTDEEELILHINVDL